MCPGDNGGGRPSWQLSWWVRSWFGVATRCIVSVEPPEVIKLVCAMTFARCEINGCVEQRAIKLVMSI